MNLAAGVHDIEVTSFRIGRSGGTAAFVDGPAVCKTVVPPSAMTASAGTWRAITGSDGRFVLQVPAALDGVVVKLLTGAGSVQVDQ